MSDVSLQLFWCVLQVTIVCCVAMTVCAILGRWKQRHPIRISQTALAVVLLLTVVSLSPWPRWSSGSSPTSNIVEAAPATTLDATAASANPKADTAKTEAPASQPSPTLMRGVTVSIDAFGRWLSVLVIPVLLASILVGGCRFMFGLRAIRRVSRDAIPLDDRALLAAVDDVRGKLGCRRRVALKESRAIGTPATIGWRRPLILLPSQWRSWTSNELRTVLAHELAHIARNDFRSIVLAQLSAVFHYYHPLVHGLVARLRLEQELAADAIAARITGGQQRYLTVLAEMALRHDDQPVAWPARPFLPMSGDLLRRIEMLKDSRRPQGTNSITTRVASVVVVLVAGFLAVGLRPDGSAAQTDDDKPLPASTSIRGVFSVRNSMNNVKQIALAMHNYYDTHKSFPTAVIKDENGVEHSWRVALLPYLDEQELYDAYRRDQPWDSPHNKELLKKLPDVYRARGAEKDSSNACYFVLAGEGSVFGGDKGTEFGDIRDGTSLTLLVVESKRDVPWTQPVDIEYTPGEELPKLGGWYSDGFVSVFADGAPHFLSNQIGAETLHNVIQIGDGNVVTSQQLDTPPRKR